MSAADAKLLPCPFCGGRAEYRAGIKTGYVMCLKCEVMGPNLPEAEAQAAWNARALRPEVAAIKGATPRTEAMIAKLEAELGDGPPCISPAAVDVAVRLRLTGFARTLERDLFVANELIRALEAQLAATPSPQASNCAATDVEEDAERYRWFRDQCDQERRTEIVERAEDVGDMLDHHIDKGRCGL